jgi:Tfp pilus assembly protein PilN
MDRLTVDLLPREQAVDERQEKLTHQLKQWSFIALGAYSLILVAIFGYRFWLQRQSVELENKKEAVKQAINDLVELESTQVLVKSKLDRAAGIVKSQRDYGKILADIFQLVPSAGAVGEVTFDATGWLKLTVSTFNIQEFVASLNVLSRFASVSESLHGVLVENIERSADGEFGFTLSFQLAE